MNRDFILISLLTIWLIASLLYFETLDEWLRAADFGRTEFNILGLALVITAVAPYVLLTIKIFRASIKAEHATSGLQRACIALGFMALCSAVIIFIWSAKNDDYIVYLLKAINEPNLYALAGVLLLSFWIHQVFYDLIASYEFSLSSVGMGLMVACHLLMFFKSVNNNEFCVGGVCDGIHVGAQFTVFSFVGIFVILVSYLMRDWLRVRAGDFNHHEGNMIIQAYGQHMIDNPISTEVLDEKLLPYPKEKILKAICWDKLE